MPFSIEEVESHFKELGFKVIVPDDVEHRKIGRALRFSTKRYVDFEGDKSVLISLIVDPDGEYLELVAPRVYNVRECPHKGAVFAALLEIAYKTRKETSSTTRRMERSALQPTCQSRMAPRRFGSLMRYSERSSPSWNNSIR